MKTRQSFQVPVSFDSANRRKDRSVSFRASSLVEISNDDFAQMDKIVGELGWMTFTVGETPPEDVIVPDSLPIEGKSYSTRMRAVLFVWWQQLGSQGDFETFYRNKMEGIITQIKNKFV